MSSTRSILRMTAFDDWRARSPYYDETHEALAQSVRRFVEREIAANIDRWEAEGELPRELHKKAAEAGILGLRYPEEYGGHSKGFDIFHGLVVTEELAAVGAGGLGASLMTHGIGLPPILALGSDELKQRFAPPVRTAHVSQSARIPLVMNILPPLTI